MEAPPFESFVINEELIKSIPEKESEAFLKDIKK